MTTPAPAEIFDALVVILIPGFFLIAVTWLVERRMDAPVDKVHRFGQHIPTTERQLLGDDWFEPVRPYFGQCRDSAERVARAVDHAVYDDPGADT